MDAILSTSGTAWLEPFSQVELLRLVVYIDSGEDPFLGYTLVQPVIKGIQGQGVIANAKHYM